MGSRIRLDRACGLSLGLGLVGLALGGCSISDSISNSITSPSESISDSSKSISDSSGSGGSSSLAANEGWQRDLRAFGAAFVGGGGDADDFLRGVGRISEGHGVTHWEAAPAILVTVGEGLRAADVPEDEVRERLAGLDPRALELVLAPYGGGAERLP